MEGKKIEQKSELTANPVAVVEQANKYVPCRVWIKQKLWEIAKFLVAAAAALAR